MKQINLKHPRPQDGQGAKVARLVRHLEARLKDFGPGGPEVLEADQERGFVTARFPGHSVSQVLCRLEEYGISVAPDGERAIFYLSPDLSFESLDRVWGCLFEIL